MGVCDLSPPAKLVVHDTNEVGDADSDTGHDSSNEGSGDDRMTSATCSGSLVATALLLHSKTTDDTTVPIMDGPQEPAVSPSSNTALSSSTDLKALIKRRAVHFPSDPTSLVQTRTIAAVTLDEHDRAQLWWTKEERRDILDRNQSILQDYLHKHSAHVQHLRQLFQDQCCCACDVDSTPTAAVSASSSSDSDASLSDSDDDDDDILFDSSPGKRQHGRVAPSLCCLHPSKRQRRQGHFRANKLNWGSQSHNNGVHADQGMELPTCVRGLEYGILPAAKNHRKAHKERILDCQDRLRNNNSNDKTSETRTAATTPSAIFSPTRSSSSTLHQQSMLSSHRSRRLAQMLAEADARQQRATEEDVDSDDEDYNFDSSWRNGLPRLVPTYHRPKPPMQRLSMMTSGRVRMVRPRMMGNGSSCW